MTQRINQYVGYFYLLYFKLYKDYFAFTQTRKLIPFDIYFTTVSFIKKYFLLPFIQLRDWLCFFKSPAFLNELFNGYLKLKKVISLGSTYFYKRIFLKKMRRPVRKYKLLNKLNSYRKVKIESDHKSKIFAYSFIFICVIMLLNPIIIYIKSNIKLILNSKYLKTFNETQENKKNYFLNYFYFRKKHKNCIQFLEYKNLFNILIYIIKKLINKFLNI